MDPISQSLIIIASLLLFGYVSELIFLRTGLPDVVLLVVAGILIGPVLGVVSPEALKPAVPFFGAIALTVILAGGGFRLRWTKVMAAAPRGLLLGVAGFILSMAAICIFCWVTTLLGLLRPASPILWIMGGAIVGGTSSVIIMPTMAKSGMDDTLARTLEVESSATDALCIVVFMALMDVTVKGSTDIVSPLVTLAKQLGIGIGSGLLASALLIPAIPAFRSKAHNFTLFLSLMLALYGVTNVAHGNGAMAILTCALLMGNASYIVPRLIPGARPEAFVDTEASYVMQDQITFITKSFFFVLIGLMFPTEPRLIIMGTAAALVLLIFRVPAVAIAMRGCNISRKQFWLLTLAIPRGLAAGILSTLPMSMGIAGVEKLSGGVFSLIVASILIFAIGFAILNRTKESTA